MLKRAAAVLLLMFFMLSVTAYASPVQLFAECEQFVSPGRRFTAEIMLDSDDITGILFDIALPAARRFKLQRRRLNSEGNLPFRQRLQERCDCGSFLHGGQGRRRRVHHQLGSGAGVQQRFRDNYAHLCGLHNRRHTLSKRARQHKTRFAEKLQHLVTDSTKLVVEGFRFVEDESDLVKESVLEKGSDKLLEKKQ